MGADLDVLVGLLVLGFKLLNVGILVSGGSRLPRVDPWLWLQIFCLAEDKLLDVFRCFRGGFLTFH